MLRRVGKSDRSRGLTAKRWLCCSVSPMVLIAIFSLAAARPAAAQTAAPTATPPTQLKRINVTAPKRKPARRAARGTESAPLPAPAPTAGNGKGPNTTLLNTNAVAESASRLGLTARETPATVEVIDQQTMREQGYRTTAEAVNGAVGVLSVDAAGAPAGFSMRGFSFGEVNV